MNTQIANYNGLSGMPILSRKGAVVGVEVVLGTMSAKDIREAGRKLGLKGNKLTEYVNKALTDETAARAAKGAVAVSALQTAGYVFDMAKCRRASAVVSFVKPPEPKTAKAKAQKAVDKLSEAEKVEVLAILLGDAK